jgi:phosphoheptose isomerase
MTKNWRNIFESSVKENREVSGILVEKLEEHLNQAAQQLLTTIRQGGKILLCGNGGSAADSQHIAAELVVRLKSTSNRPAIAAQLRHSPWIPPSLPPEPMITVSILYFHARLKLWESMVMF